jgi:hypothetical protein
MFDVLARTSGTSEPIKCPRFVRCLSARNNSATAKHIVMDLDIGELHPHLETVRSPQPTKRTVLFLGYLCYSITLKVHTYFDPQRIIIRELNKSQCWLTLDKITTLYIKTSKFWRSISTATRLIFIGFKNISMESCTWKRNTQSCATQFSRRQATAIFEIIQQNKYLCCIIVQVKNWL